MGQNFTESHIDGTDQTSLLDLVIHSFWHKITSHRLIPNLLLTPLVLQDMQYAIFPQVPFQIPPTI